MAPPKVTDVALRAGVSVASVSRALSGRPGVSDAMRRRVLTAARELNYQPDEVARSMRRRQSNLIGLVVSTIENTFFTEIARSAEQAALRYGFNLLISSTDERLDREQLSFEVLRRQLAAGIILAPTPGDISGRSYLDPAGPPIVLINRELGVSALSSILADDEVAAFDCTRWLLQQGRRRIGVVAGLEHISTTRERLKGYQRALTAEGIAVDEQLIVRGFATAEGGYRAACDLMLRTDPPDAIFVHNNVMLSGAVLALRDLKIEWPKQIEIAGFGAFSAARLYQPPITLIAQPTHEMGQRAVSLLADHLAGGAMDWPQHLLLPNRLITREDWLRQKQERESWIRRRLSAPDDWEFAVD